MMWPTDDDDFSEIVSQAMEPGPYQSNARMRDLLAKPDVIGRTVAALETIVDRIDDQLEHWEAPPHVRERRERARDAMWGRLVWYRALAADDE